MAKLLKTSGERSELKPGNGRKAFNLKELQDAVGGYVQIVTHKDGQMLVVNEEGKVDGLAFNAEASVVFTSWFGPIDVIVGDALLCESFEIK